MKCQLGEDHLEIPPGIHRSFPHSYHDSLDHSGGNPGFWSVRKQSQKSEVSPRRTIRFWACSLKAQSRYGTFLKSTVRSTHENSRPKTGKPWDLLGNIWKPQVTIGVCGEASAVITSRTRSHTKVWMPRSIRIPVPVRCEWASIWSKIMWCGHFNWAVTDNTDLLFSFQLLQPSFSFSSLFSAQMAPTYPSLLDDKICRCSHWSLRGLAYASSMGCGSRFPNWITHWSTLIRNAHTLSSTSTMFVHWAWRFWKREFVFLHSFVNNVRNWTWREQISVRQRWPTTWERRMSGKCWGPFSSVKIQHFQWPVSSLFFLRILR